jgi:hypothetical protein
MVEVNATKQYSPALAIGASGEKSSSPASFHPGVPRLAAAGTGDLGWRSSGGCRADL